MAVMKRRVTALVLVLILAVSFMAVIPAAALGRIKNIEHTLYGSVRWNSFSGADRYKVEIESTDFCETYYVTTAEFKYQGLFTKKGTVYDIFITAIDSSGNALSERASTYVIKETLITGLKINDDLTVEWNDPGCEVDHYYVNVRAPDGGVGGFVAEECRADLTEELADDPSGRYRVWVIAAVKRGNQSETIASTQSESFDYVNKNNFVTTTDVVIAPPVVGSTPSFEAHITLNDGELSAADCIEEYRVIWRNIDGTGNATGPSLGEGSVFEEGKAYKVYVFVTLKKGTYLDKEVANDMPLDSSLNGVPVYMNRTAGYYEYSVNALQTVRAHLDKVDITVSEPVGGKNAGSCSNAESSAKNVYVSRSGAFDNKCIWLDDTGKERSDDAKFELGKTYTARLRIIYSEMGTPAYNWEYINKDTKVTVNDGIQARYVGTDDGYAVFDADIKCVTHKPYVEQASITAATPTAGAKVSNTAKYDKTIDVTGVMVIDNRLETVPGVVIWYDGDKRLTEDDTFEGGKTYTVKARVNAKSEYDLTKDTVIYINGVKATCTAESFDRYVLYSADIVCESDRTPGDLNNDTKVDLKDGLLISQHLAGWKVAINASNADVNGDNKVDLKDGLLLKQFLAGWKVTLK